MLGLVTRLSTHTGQFLSGLGILFAVMVYFTGLSGYSEEVIQRLLKAAENVGVEAKRFGAGKLEKTLGRLSGDSDAAAFSKAGIKAGFLNSADWKTRSSYYHQSTDTLDKIRKGTLEIALKICIAFLKNELKPKD